MARAVVCDCQLMEYLRESRDYLNLPSYALSRIDRFLCLAFFCLFLANYETISRSDMQGKGGVGVCWALTIDADTQRLVQPRRQGCRETGFSFFPRQPLSMAALTSGLDGLPVMSVTTFSSLQKLLYAELWRGKVSW